MKRLIVAAVLAALTFSATAAENLHCGKSNHGLFIDGDVIGFDGTEYSEPLTLKPFKNDAQHILRTSRKGDKLVIIRIDDGKTNVMHKPRGADKFNFYECRVMK